MFSYDRLSIYNLVLTSMDIKFEPMHPTLESIFWGGIIYSVLLGGVASYQVWRFSREYIDTHKCYLKLPADDVKRNTVLPITIGVLERIFFTIIVAYNVSAAAAGITTWIMIKMLSGWNRFQRDEYGYKVLSFNALICNLISLSFAVIGGLIMNRMIDCESAIYCIILTLILFGILFLVREYYKEKWAETGSNLYP
jgi:hypothetical protein